MTSDDDTKETSDTGRTGKILAGSKRLQRFDAAFEAEQTREYQAQDDNFLSVKTAYGAAGTREYRSAACRNRSSKTNCHQKRRERIGKSGVAWLCLYRCAQFPCLVSAFRRYLMASKDSARRAQYFRRWSGAGIKSSFQMIKGMTSSGQNVIAPVKSSHVESNEPVVQEVATDCACGAGNWDLIPSARHRRKY